MTDLDLNRNPLTKKQSQRETFWQIVLPVVVVALIAIALVVLLLVQERFAEAAVLSDYIMIWLLFFLVISGLPLLLLLVGMSSLTKKGVNTIPEVTFKGQKALIRIEKWADEFTDSIAGALIRIKSIVTGVKRGIGTDPIQKQVTNVKENEII